MHLFAHVISLISVLLSALLGQYFTNYGLTFYKKWYDCIKASITPPAIVFPIVWTILYVIITIALARTIITKNTNLIIVFYINLLLNILWCYAYFYLKNPLDSLIILFVILASIVYLIINSEQFVKYMLLPYLFWIMFAFFLNYMSISKIKLCK